MTQIQAAQIRELRLRGAGYKSIATMTGLTRDIVRNYCKSHGLDGLCSDLTVNMKEQMERGKVCWYCGRPLLQPHTGRRKKFCSDSCRRAWWKSNPEATKRSESAYYHLMCACCGTEFVSYGNRSRKYCSHECYIRDRFWRDEDGRPPYTPDKEDPYNE